MVNRPLLRRKATWAGQLRTGSSTSACLLGFGLALLLTWGLQQTTRWHGNDRWQRGSSGTSEATVEKGSGALSGLPAPVRQATGQQFLSDGVPCHRATRAGLCISDVFNAVDEAYRDLWPGRVDLLVRSYVSDKFFLLNLLLHSIDQMWPKNIGDVVLVLDEGNALAHDLVPTWVKVFYEKNYLGLPGKILQQWSYGWADNYTTAPFVAIIDDDVVFSLKVTPSLLFNLSTGRPYIIASNQTQENNWLPSTHFLVGPTKYYANFMVQLPFVAPRYVFKAFRDHVGKIHPEHDGTYDGALKWFAFNGPDVKRTQIQHTALGNFMYHYTPDAAHWAREWTEATPIPRVGVHLPYAQAFRVATNHIDGIPRVTAVYAELAGHFAHEGVCHSFPRGELEGCEEVLKFGQRQIWMYALDWFDWPLMFKKRIPQSTQVYDTHIEVMKCIYASMVGAKNAAVKDASSTDVLRSIQLNCMAPFIFNALPGS